MHALFGINFVAIYQPLNTKACSDMRWQNRSSFCIHFAFLRELIYCRVFAAFFNVAVYHATIEQAFICRKYPSTGIWQMWQQSLVCFFSSLLFCEDSFSMTSPCLIIYVYIYLSFSASIQAKFCKQLWSMKYVIGTWIWSEICYS